MNNIILKLVFSFYVASACADREEQAFIVPGSNETEQYLRTHQVDKFQLRQFVTRLHKATYRPEGEIIGKAIYALAYSDHNGAMDNPSDRTLQSYLDKGYEIQVERIKTYEELCNLVKKTQPNDLIIHGHGTENYIQLNEIEIARPDNVAAVIEPIKKNGSVLLISCSTGAGHNSIAAAIASVRSDLTVIAPQRVTHRKDIRISEKTPVTFWKRVGNQEILSTTKISPTYSLNNIYPLLVRDDAPHYLDIRKGYLSHELTIAWLDEKFNPEDAIQFYQKNLDLYSPQEQLLWSCWSRLAATENLSLVEAHFLARLMTFDHQLRVNEIPERFRQRPSLFIFILNSGHFELAKELAHSADWSRDLYLMIDIYCGVSSAHRYFRNPSKFENNQWVFDDVDSDLPNPSMRLLIEATLPIACNSRFSWLFPKRKNTVYDQMLSEILTSLQHENKKKAIRVAKNLLRFIVKLKEYPYTFKAITDLLDSGVYSSESLISHFSSVSKNHTVLSKTGQTIPLAEASQDDIDRFGKEIGHNVDLSNLYPSLFTDPEYRLGFYSLLSSAHSENYLEKIKARWLQEIEFIKHSRLLEKNSLKNIVDICNSVNGIPWSRSWDSLARFIISDKYAELIKKVARTFKFRWLENFIDIPQDFSDKQFEIAKKLRDIGIFFRSYDLEKIPQELSERKIQVLKTLNSVGVIIGTGHLHEIPEDISDQQIEVVQKRIAAGDEIYSDQLKKILEGV